MARRFSICILILSPILALAADNAKDEKKQLDI